MIFNVANDSPTLTGAKVTFTISLEFPHTQKVLPNGDVVWAADCLFNGETLTHMIHSVLQSIIHPFIIIPSIPSLHHHSSQVSQSCFMSCRSNLPDLWMWKLAVLKRISSLTAGTKYGALEPVYPPRDPAWEAGFPDGTPFTKDKTPNYVFVWKAWGEWGSSSTC